MQLPITVAQPQLPDLSAQPPWVAVLITVLFVAGWVGTHWVGRGRGRRAELEEGGDEQDETRPPTAEGVPSGVAVPAEHHATAVIMRALDLLHLEAEESRDGREDAAKWRDEALELRRQLEDCHEQLERHEPRLGEADR